MENSKNSGTPATFRSIDYITIAVFGFALAGISNGLHAIILPIRMMDFAAESQKNTYLGLLTFAGLIVAMLVQPAAGAVSDHSRFQWGRRRPYIVFGAMAVAILLTGIGTAQSYICIFIIWCLLQACANIAQGPYQAFIPDLVPDGKRGRAAGVKILFEVLGGATVLRLVGYLMGKQSAGAGDFWLWLSLGTLAVFILGAMVATILTVKEKQPSYLPPQSVISSLKGTFNINLRANHDFLYFLASRLLFLMALTTIQTFMLYYLKDVAGLPNPASATADLIVVVGVAMIAVVYPTGYLSDRVGRKPIGICAGILGAVGVALLFLSNRYEYILFCGGIIGISAGAFMSTNWALATDLVSKGEEARYMGLTNLATAGGAALARLIGPAIDFLNMQSANMGYTAMLLACCAYFIIGSGLLLKIKGKAKPENATASPSP